MSFTYDPNDLLAKIAPKKKVEGMLNKRTLELKKSALSFVDRIDFLSKEKVVDTALKVLKDYKKRFQADDAVKKKIKQDPKLLIQRVQQSILFQVKEEIKAKYRGEFYIWLPSNAKEPDPLHQLKYGKRYRVGVGEMPQDRYGCQCGMRIITNEDELKL